MAQSGASLAGRIELRDEGMDGLLKPRHKIFLSHNGAQKAFVELLCLELEKCFRFPFFDQRWDSLPIGENFPKHIFDAIRQCQVGVVILSEEFLTSKWPMMELVAMVDQAKKNPNFKILPIFFRTSIKEFKDPRHQCRWRARWRKLALENPARLQVKKCEATLKYLDQQNGLEYDGSSELKFQKVIVDVICGAIPADIRLEDSYIQGRSRLCKVIQDKIDAQENSRINGVCVVGLYGVAGIGKTSICKALCNEFFTRFHGRVCLAELEKGSEEELMHEVVHCLSNSSHLHKLNIYQLENGLREGKFIKEAVFLALDNFIGSDASIKQVKRYLSAKLPSGSIVMLTTRSKDLLSSMSHYINENNFMEMPVLNVEEATALFVKSCEKEDGIDKRLIEQCVMRCCFQKYGPCRSESSNSRSYYNYSNCYENDWEYDEYYNQIRRHDHHYHPLALDVLGRQLGRIHQSKWRMQLRLIDEDIFNLTRENAHPLFSILKKSFYALSLEDQLLFMDVALFLPHPMESGCNVFEWLGMVHGIPSVEDVKSRLESLKTKSLLERLGDGPKTRIGMHDLWRSFCVAETKAGNAPGRRWAYVAPKTPCELFYSPASGIWQSVQRMAFVGSTGFTPAALLQSPHFAHFSNVLVLKMVGLCMRRKIVLDLSGLTHLKSLEVFGRQLPQFKGLPKGLIFLSFRWGEEALELDSSQHLLKEIEGLRELEYLQLINFQGEKLPNMSHMISLRKAIFHYCKNVVTLSGLRPNLPTRSGIVSFRKTIFQCISSVTTLFHSNLQVLDLRGCSKLQSCPGVGDLISLEVLNCRECVKLEKLPDLRKLTSLQKLDISECFSINEVPGLSELVALVELHAGLSKKQPATFRVPNMHNLKNLQVLHLGNRRLETLPGFDSLHSLRKVVADFQNIPNRPSLIQVTKLEKLKISGIGSSAGLKELQNLTMLHSLEIGTCSAIHSLPDLSTLLNLHTLKIVDCGFKQVSGLTTLSTLERLQIEGCPNLERIPDLQQLTRLSVLEIRACSLLTGWDYPQRPITGHKYLRTLTLWRCAQLADVRAFSQLETLDLWELGITELPDLSSFCALRNLTLWKCESLEILTSHKPMNGLSILLVHGCSKLLTLPDLSSFPGLLELRLEEGKITTSRTTLRCSAPLPALQLLVLHSTGISLPDMGVYFPALREVDLEGSAGLTTLRSSVPMRALQVLKLAKCLDLGALPDLKMFPALTSLDVSQCCRLLRLGSSAPLPALRELDARMCISLNRGELGALQALCPNCRIEDIDEQ